MEIKNRNKAKELKFESEINILKKNLNNSLQEVESKENKFF